ncbi:hypothetical protein BHM03_00011578 [Ensete ventricosum]|nr:hypothetical protein BHM03_00011578 [Ensete ventricosum]
MQMPKWIEMPLRSVLVEVSHTVPRHEETNLTVPIWVVAPPSPHFAFDFPTPTPTETAATSTVTWRLLATCYDEPA